MKHQAFAVFDSAAEMYSNPIFFRSKGEALRWFQDSASDESSPLNKHPKDFSLTYLGEYDDETGEFQESIKISMMTGIEAKAANEAEHGPQIGDGPPILTGTEG